jgi:O-antigen/teichoic acid export membrane protein
LTQDAAKPAVSQTGSDSLPDPEESIAASQLQATSNSSATAIRGGAIRVMGYAIGVLVSLGAATVLVRYLGIASFGRYVTVTSLIALVASVTEAGISVYGIREFVARGESDRQRLMANLLGMRLTLTLVGIGCAVCFGLAVGYAQVLVVGTIVTGVGLLVQVISEVMSISLQAQLRLGRLAIVEMIRRVVALVLIVTLALLGATLLPFLAVSILAGVVALAILAWMVRASLTIQLRFDRHMWRELFAETLPFAIAVSIGAIYFYVTVILMSLIATANQTGIFATSFRVTQAALAIPGLLLTAIFPLMSRARPDQESGLGEMLSKVFIVAVVCGVWMSLAMALGASFIINVIAGSQGQAAISVLRIQGLVFTGSFISTASVFGFLSLRRYRPMVSAISSALALNILLGLVLVPTLGARGGALADVLTEVVLAIGLTVLLMHAVPGYQIRASVVLPLVLATALSATVLLLPVGPVARVIVATFIYFSTLLRMGSIPDEVTDAVRRLRAVRTLL